MYKIIGADQQEYGPVSAAQLRQWVAEGRVNGQTSVQADGTTEWKPLAAFPEFAALLTLQAVPPPYTSSANLPSGSNAVAQQLLAGDSDFDIGDCLSRAWKLLMSNFGLLAGATTLIWLIDSVVMFIPLIGGIATMLLSGVLYGGLFLVYLKRIRGQPASVGDAFSGFKTSFVQLMLTSLVTKLLSAIGFIFCVLPGIYLKVAWFFSIPLVADKRLEFWSAMELSRKITTRVWFKVFLLLLIAFAPFMIFNFYALMKAFNLAFELFQSGSPDFQKMMDFAGASVRLNLLGRLVLLVNLPFALGAILYAYEDLFNPRTARTG
ncbi:MAG: hypothetical protein JWR19_1006 [Pedosphaera sp.]|nr:hypothetical protein [Pedosphaera sp.]